MAAPTAPTVATLTEEACNKVSYATPSCDINDRAETNWMEEIKNDIWTKGQAFGSTRFRSLQTDQVQITTIGLAKYDFNTDFDEPMSISFLNGTHTGTATAGASNSITLAADEDVSVASCEGNWMLLTGGTGSAQLRQVTDYSTSTLVATVSPVWGTSPDATTTYRIIDTVTELDEEDLSDIGSLGTFSKANPSAFARINEGHASRFILDKPPDASTYGLYIRYYANLMEVDVASTLYTNLLTNWRAPITYGLACRVAETLDDDRYMVFKAEYEKLTQQLLDLELVYVPFEGFEG